MLPEPINDKVHKKVAEDMDLPVKQVREIVMSQSKFTAHIMRSNLFDSVRWPYLGIFKAKVKSANVLNYMKGLTKEQRKFFQDQQKLKYEKKYNKPSKQYFNFKKKKKEK